MRLARRSAPLGGTPLDTSIHMTAVIPRPGPTEQEPSPSAPRGVRTIGRMQTAVQLQLHRLCLSGRLSVCVLSVCLFGWGVGIGGCLRTAYRICGYFRRKVWR